MLDPAPPQRQRDRGEPGKNNHVTGNRLARVAAPEQEQRSAGDERTTLDAASYKAGCRGDNDRCDDKDEQWAPDGHDRGDLAQVLSQVLGLSRGAVCAKAAQTNGAVGTAAIVRRLAARSRSHLRAAPELRPARLTSAMPVSRYPASGSQTRGTARGIAAADAIHAQGDRRTTRLRSSRPSVPATPTHISGETPKIETPPT